MFIPKEAEHAPARPHAGADGIASVIVPGKSEPPKGTCDGFRTLALTIETVAAGKAATTDKRYTPRKTGPSRLMYYLSRLSFTRRCHVQLPLSKQFPRKPRADDGHGSRYRISTILSHWFPCTCTNVQRRRTCSL